jgi:hypothetical protein
VGVNKPQGPVVESLHNLPVTILAAPPAAPDTHPAEAARDRGAARIPPLAAARPVRG